MAASSPSALFHSATRWDPNGVILLGEGKGSETESVSCRESKVAQLSNPPRADGEWGRWLPDTTAWP